MSEEPVAEKTLPKYILDDIIANLYLFNLIKKSEKKGVMTHVPIGLSPSPIPESFFNKISFYQIAFNKILEKISKDQALLEEILTPITEKDEFVKKCLEISKKVSTFENKSKIDLAFIRNDYMVDKNKKFIFLNDIKTQNLSLYAYSDKLKCAYDYFMKKYPEDFKKFLGENNMDKIPLLKEDTIPNMAKSMIEAIKLSLGKEENKDIEGSLVVFVVNPEEKYNFELKMLENYLYDNYKINVKCMPLNEITKKCAVDEKGIIKTEEKQICLFYFATGNSAADYKDDDSWAGREMIELSNAVKCPSINLFLVSLEVFLHKLRDTEFIKKFITEELIINDMLRFFTPSNYIREFTEDKKKEIFANLFKDMSLFYLKNMKKDNEAIFGGENILSIIPNEATEINEDIKNIFILEKINSPEFECKVIKDEEESKITACSSFSCFGIIMVQEANLVTNKAVSYLVRTLPKDEIEGEILDNDCYLELPLLLELAINKEDSEPIKY